VSQLHQRILKIGTIPEFLRWFDALHAGNQLPTAGTAVTISRSGQLDLSVSTDGAVKLVFTPT
jgi:hypothetical protein